jgi:hypothetical protein
VSDPLERRAGQPFRHCETSDLEDLEADEELGCEESSCP